MSRAGTGLPAALLAALAAAPALAASGGEQSGAGELWGFLNLALLIGAIVFLGRKPIQAFFGDRRAQIRAELEGAARQLKTAEERHVELQRRLQDLDQALERVREMARERAREESERLLADARAAAERIREDARAAVGQEAERARRELREEAASLALELAARRLQDQVTDADRDRLVDEFIARVEAGPAGPNGSGA